jgi:hypothetical protein
MWTGWGGLAYGFAAIIPAATTILASIFIGDPNYYKTHGWPTAVGLWITAGVVWVLGRWLNRPWPRAVRDARTGREALVQSGGGHRFLFLPMHYWAVFWAAMGFYILFNPGVMG